MNDAFIFLGVNDLQKHAILNAKSLGYRCIGFDRNKYAKSQKYCDYFYNIDSTDISALFSKINTHKVDVKGIWANNDILVPTRLVLAYLLGIKDTDIATGVKMLDKLSFRGLVSAKNYFIPWEIVEKNDECPLKFPVITKPVIGGGSQGIKIINNGNEYKAVNTGNPILIESFIEGFELGINIFTDGIKTQRLGAVYRYFNHNKHHIPIGTITEYDNKVISKAFDVLEDYINELNYYGMVKADILIDRKGKVYLLELSPRFHGEIDTEYIFSYIDYSLSTQYFRYLKNKDFSNQNFENEFHYGYISLFLDGHTKMPDIKFDKLPLEDFYGVELLQHIPHRYYGEILSMKPRSTYDIVAFSVFRSKEKLSDNNFLKISNKLNKIINAQNE
jgi:hypothetical protein